MERHVNGKPVLCLKVRTFFGQVVIAEQQLEAESPGFVALEESPPLLVTLLTGQVQCHQAG